MRAKLLIGSVVLFGSVLLLSCSMHSNYRKAKEEAERRNAEIKKQQVLEFAPNRMPRLLFEEVLMGIFANGTELSIRVRTGGCTRKEDFWISCKHDATSQGGPPHYVLTIYRTKEDRCEAFFPSGTLIKFDLQKELGLPKYFTYSVVNHVEAGLLSVW